MTTTQTDLFCDGTSSTVTNEGTIYDGPGAMVSGLPILVSDPNHPGHFAGRQTIEHVEEPRAGGSKITDSFVEWDLQRRQH